MKLLYVDVETSGLPFPESGLVQLAGAIEIGKDKPKTFCYRIRPFPDDVIEDEALAINRTTREQLLNYEEPRKVHTDFVELLARYVDRFDSGDKFHLIAYNAAFDTGHLRAWFEKNNDRYYGSWFFHPAIDVMGMAAVRLMAKRGDMVNFKLLTVAKELGMKVDETKAHDAGYDVAVTRAMFKRLMKTG